MAIEKLKHRNYFQVAEGNIEFIRGDIWDIEVPTDGWPLAVYSPGMDMIKTRLKSMSINMNNATGKIQKEIFAQQLHQNAGRDIQNGTITMQFLDKEDQAITNIANDWLNQIGDPDTGFGRHKKELLLNMDVVFYNTLLSRVREYKCIAGILDSADIPDTPGEKGSDLSDVSLSISFELMKRFIL